MGFLFGTKDIYSLQNSYFLLHFFFFLIPANIFLYGVNDFFDEDTDQFNTKKGTIEYKLVEKDKNNLIGILLICLSLTFFLISLQTDTEVQLIFCFFLFLSYFYSAPPLRFKAKPLIDFSSNILYALPALIAYYQTTQSFPPYLIIIALFSWTASMHLFSAIPDIQADKKANLLTSAVVLGKTSSIILCLLFWSISSVITIYLTGSYFALLSLVYPLIPLLLILNKRLDIKKVYWYFPYINTAIGFSLFLYAVLNK